MKDTIRLKTSVKVILVLALAAALVLSMTVLTKLADDSAISVGTMRALDEKKADVIRFTEVVAASATAIAAVPGDATSPVAEELADLTSYFLMILAVIYVEKCLVSLAGYAAFFILVPVACVLGAAWALSGRRAWRIWAVKFLVFALAVYFVIPASMFVSDRIELAMDTSYAETIEEAEEITDDINESTDADGNVLEKVWDRFKGGVSGLLEKGKTLLTDLVKTIAEMLVTSCGIPVAVMAFIVWLIKMLFRASGAVPVVVQPAISAPQAAPEEEEEEAYVS